MKTRRYFFGALIMYAIIISTTTNLFAQNDKKEEGKIHLKMEKIINGKTTTIDTTIFMDQKFDMKELNFSDHHDKSDDENVFSIHCNQDDDNNTLLFDKIDNSDDFISRNENVLDSLMKNKPYTLDTDGNKIYTVKGNDKHDLILKKLNKHNKYSFSFHPPLTNWNGEEFSFGLDDKLLKVKLDSLKNHAFAFLTATDSMNFFVEKNCEKIDSLRKKVFTYQFNFDDKQLNKNIDSIHKIVIRQFNDSLDFNMNAINENMEFNIFNYNELDSLPFSKDIQVIQNGDTLITKQIIKHHAKDKSGKHKKIMIYNSNTNGTNTLHFNNSGNGAIATITIEDLKETDKKQLKNKGVNSEVDKYTLKPENLVFTPNPNNGKFKLEFNLPEKGKTSIKIFDTNAKEVYNESLGNFDGNYSKDIDISKYGKGTYFLQISQGKKMISKKMVIQ